MEATACGTDDSHSLAALSEISRLRIPGLLSLFALLRNLASLKLSVLESSGNHAHNGAFWTFA